MPLIVFGGGVAQTIDSRWHSHASLTKTAIDLLGLPAIGIPRVDQAPTLATLVDPGMRRPPPPRHGSPITQPTPPTPPPAPTEPAPWPEPLAQPMPPLVTNTGAPLPAPTDGIVRPKPPKGR